MNPERTEPEHEPTGRTAAREASLATVERFFSTLEAMDVDAFLELWAPDGVQEMPFAPEGFPERLEGREAIATQYGGLPTAYGAMRFERTLRPLADPEYVLVQYRGRIELNGGGRYDNDYCGLFRVVDDRIVRFTEYFDPVVLNEAFGDARDDTFGVDEKD